MYLREELIDGFTCVGNSSLYVAWGVLGGFIMLFSNRIFKKISTIFYNKF